MSVSAQQSEEMSVSGEEGDKEAGHWKQTQSQLSTAGSVGQAHNVFLIKNSNRGVVFAICGDIYF